MSKRARSHVVLAAAALAGGVYGWLSLGWGDLAFYGGEAAVIVLICGIGLPWMELAPDGAWQRRPEA